ncbi:3102_t:CDS:2 [Gigaspora margarita]|uniref:3102_t:CDS:1 n=1 Tax=Gigaspora margarita TaxID=4874 RepID=A0ABM8W2E9_GIGMA|nr:3102_t:CDS:2 [Gigaspora margarita]
MNMEKILREEYYKSSLYRNYDFAVKIRWSNHSYLYTEPYEPIVHGIFDNQPELLYIHKMVVAIQIIKDFFAEIMTRGRGFGHPDYDGLRHENQLLSQAVGGIVEGAQREIYLVQNSELITPGKIKYNSELLIPGKIKYNSELITPGKIKYNSELITLGKIKYNSELITPGKIKYNSELITPGKIKYYSELITPGKIKYNSERITQGKIKYNSDHKLKIMYF